MTTNKFLKLISQGEGINIEFKESKTDLNKDVFETVCAFLNRNGGHLFLGVTDTGKIGGIDDDKIDNILKNFLTTLNNPQKISPSVYLNAEVIKIKNKKIIIILQEKSLIEMVMGILILPIEKI